MLPLHLRALGALQPAIKPPTRFPSSGDGSHATERCYRLSVGREAVKNAPRPSKGKGKPRRGNAAQEQDLESAQAVQKAGAASLDPRPSQTRSADTWNADTGASAHMSPHRSCFRSYGPSSTLVEVANGQVVKAAGVGSVEFHPV
ncbi:hypothetical protein DL93DRAFT_2061608, partial [Clavulina sp. PMI_390]